MREEVAATGQVPEFVLDVWRRSTESSSYSSKPLNAVGTELLILRSRLYL